MRIKKFNEEIGFTDIQRDRDKIGTKIMDNLRSGFAVVIFTENISDFMSVLSKNGVDNDLPKNHIIFTPNDRSKSKYHFVLLGNKIFFIDGPMICHQKVDTYIPSW